MLWPFARHHNFPVPPAAYPSSGSTPCGRSVQASSGHAFLVSPQEKAYRNRHGGLGRGTLPSADRPDAAKAHTPLPSLRDPRISIRPRQYPRTPHRPTEGPNPLGERTLVVSKESHTAALRHWADPPQLQSLQRAGLRAFLSSRIITPL